ncbi:MAG: prolipoprotein diacylglyceryl transferase family protein [Bacilli bacterium]
MYPKIGGIIPTYPILLCLGVFMCFVYLHIYYRHTEHQKSLVTAIEINACFAVAVGVICALLFQNLYDFIDNPAEYTWNWDMTFFGGLLGGVASFLIGYFAVMRKQYGPFMDKLLIIAPACISVAHGFGRIGCFFNGCCYGLPTDSWVGIKFTTTATKVIPTNLFEAIFLLLLSVLLLSLAVRKHFVFNFPIYMLSYGVFRFVIEFFRGDERGSFIPGISPSQFWAIILFIGGIAYLILEILLINRKRKEEIKNGN